MTNPMNIYMANIQEYSTNEHIYGEYPAQSTHTWQMANDQSNERIHGTFPIK